jgi:DNA-binding NarL/FixJ family response regulator
MSIKIIIAEDHPIFRDGLKTLINSYPDFEVVAEVEDGNALIKAFKLKLPDIALVDINMPIINGIEATKFITSHFPKTKIIALTMNDERSSIVDMINAGANGYVLKSANKEEIAKAIYTVNEGEDYFSKEISKSIIDLIVDTKSNTSNGKNITFNDKEKRIIKYMCEEYSSDEIAKMMFLSKKTIDGIRLKIKNDLNVRNSFGIAKYAIKNGLYKI